MLNDKVRVEAYKLAISESVKDKIVIDVGTGTGILAIMSAEHEARHVYALENSDIIR